MRRRKSENCPACGRPLAPQGLAETLSPLQRRIFNLVSNHGEVMPDILYQAIWGSDPNGGPGPKGLHVAVHNLNKRLAAHGVAVRSRKGGNRYGAMPYRLVAEAAE